MYNYGAPPGYNRPPGYGGSPPMAPPGMGPPPGASTPAAPGVAPPPGVSANGPPQLGGPRPLPSSWQPPTSMPNINFNAPVIRLGTAGPGRGGGTDGSAGRRESTQTPMRRGLGMDMNMRDADQQKGRETTQLLIPPTREEIARTIFIGNIAEGVSGDEGMERILETAGSLRRWTRATDANNKPQTFGFAEYEDAQSLETAAEVFKNVLVPTKRQEPGKVKQEGEEEEVEKTKLQVMVDDASVKYYEEWKARRNEDEATAQFRIDTAKDLLAQVLASLFNPRTAPPIDHSSDIMMHDTQAQDGDGAEIIHIPLSAAEDELADIPAEMREIVASEIASFRDRSIQRDQERLRREEEMEAEERRRSGRRSPPLSAPTGPSSSGVNGVPLGPKADRGIQGAPSGPKGSQFPRDYQGAVNFTNGGTLSNGIYINHEYDDDPASDSEIERRHKKKAEEEQDEVFKRKLNTWLKHESRSATSLQRTSDRMKNQENELQQRRDAQANHLKNFDDDHEASRKSVPFYRDPGAYMRERQRIKEKEEKDDALDRAAEERELAAQEKEREIARGLADSFLDQQAEELQRRTQARQEPARFKLSLGAAAKKIEEAAAPRRTAAEVENLLEDEEIAEQPSHKRTLKPILFDQSVRVNLTAEEIAEAQQVLAREIPNDKDGLWKWPVSWDHLLDKNIDKDIKDWAEKKILDTLGVQEDMLVEAIIDHLKNKGEPQDLVENLEGALDEEAELLVKKLWRVVIYYSECEKRGIK
ncbi:hypothetical protein CC78DRAFT_499995 [Lojkania enalia]|uniref:PWI domain-containing protein n=1 Tax=Lojkania enalia TaxID=147567 RepID=A0A9P4K7I4_9PLEO|nr:hypothetical protein CC78DRAFT_499995 [Didymosphaeria enalia]